MRWLCLLSLAVGALGGCGNSGITGEIARFKDTGHTASEFADADANSLGAKKCQTGTVDQMSVLLCEYAGSDAAALGQGAGERWLGESASGVVLRRGNLLFAVADRTHTDPNGKAISSLAKIFRRANGK